MLFYEKLVDFDTAVGGDLLIKHTQEIPEDYISQLKRDKINADHNRAGEFERVASIPVVIVEKWLREGFDIDKESIGAIVKRLRDEHLDAFITTNRQV